MTDDTIHTCSYYCERPECVRRQRDELRDRLEADLAQRPAAVDGLAARLVDELDGLVGESYGVSGLHLNGDVAPWDELLPGGRFERLSSLDDLRAALAAAQQRIACLPADWREDSSLETWFPFTAQQLAALQAENERLRAEVAAWRELSDHVRVGACAAIWPDRYTDARTRDVAAALKRAARMEEALALLPPAIVMVEHNPYEGPIMFCCGQRVTSGGLHDLLTNHSKECWYARMRALRDHDQENKA